jgi:hypothetical protein
MSVEFKLEVLRNLDNRRLLGDYKDASPLAWDSHRQRGEALHAIFNNDSRFAVVEGDWSKVDDKSRTHELVTLALLAVGTTVLTFGAAAAGIVWIGLKLRDIKVDEKTASSAQSLIEKIRPAQHARHVETFSIIHSQFRASVLWPEAGGETISLSATDKRAIWTHRFGDEGPSKL